MRFFIPLVLAVVLAGCTPAVRSSVTSSGDVAVVTVRTERTTFSLVSLNIVSLDASPISTTDSRCGNTQPDLIQCDLGSLDVGDVVMVPVNAPGSNIGCFAAGYVGGSLTDYRIVRCDRE